jgi:3-hydroxymyristoyl/3-hydroxydecanoyl-(acyl carrier protein) dehydratase
LGQRGQVSYEPAVGIATRLKCRGQIVESTALVTYEVAIKEFGQGNELYAVADALIYADGKPIVEVRDMVLQLRGTDGRALECLWSQCLGDEERDRAEGTGLTASASRIVAGVVPVPIAASGKGARDEGAARGPLDACPPSAKASRDSGGRAPLFDRDRILAFAIGRPSDGFGDRYRPFDSERFIARLPGPPYQFIHKVVEIQADPWVMKAGGSAVAEYDVAPDAWFFAADRQDQMPFAVLLEVALQACGWLAAYMGSALTSDDDLKFRNLGGSARLLRQLTRSSGTLATRVRVSKISSLAGMIIQQYDFAVHDRDGLVYEGSTEFGFFHPRTLEEQVGIRDKAPYRIGTSERAGAGSFPFPTDAPFPDRDWRMVDEVEALVEGSGPHRLGVVRGSTVVDPSAWFFKAHFLGDPVWPGSLGLESLLQLLKLAARSRWGASPGSVFESPAAGRGHRWNYRGQIIPTNRRVTVQAEITVCDDRERLLVADGYLEVDGRVIYQMNDFSIRLCGPAAPKGSERPSL